MITYKKRKNEKKERENNNNINDDVMPRLAFTMSGKCYCCGKEGHKLPACQFKDKIPREEWVINKEQQQHAQTNNNNEMDNNSSQNNNERQNNNDASSSASMEQPSKNKVIGWSDFHVMMLQAYDMSEHIILDSGSTSSVFCNENYVKNIKEA